ncbi:hypothetical protein FGG78_29885 [Thioclava sp. BHET1]|nr:hypothetical protein FGG78_29885 [Thioclava sp. BHET1]
MRRGGLLLLWVAMLCVVIGSGFYLLLRNAYQNVASNPGGLEGDNTQMTLVPKSGGEPAILAITGYSSIDNPSDPRQFHACFDIATPLDALEQAYQPYPDPAPQPAPTPMPCFNPAAISSALKAGTAQAFLSHSDIAPGIDRVIVISKDGHGFAWQQSAAAAAPAKDKSQSE